MQWCVRCRSMALCRMFHLTRVYAEVFECYGGPVVATHSNVRRVTGHHRNLTEKQIREIVRRGGLIGINLCSAFLSSDRMRACSDDVYRHLDVFLSLGAQDTVCFGTDFDGACAGGYPGYRGIPRLYGYLLARGLPETVLNKVFLKTPGVFEAHFLERAGQSRSVPRKKSRPCRAAENGGTAG